MTNRYTFRPGLASRAARWWPSPPAVTGGTEVWVPTEAEVKWLATGKGLRGRKSTDKHALCVGGPLHGVKVKRRWYVSHGKSKELMAVMPPIFAVPPWAGNYQWDILKERYQWQDLSVST